MLSLLTHSTGLLSPILLSHQRALELTSSLASARVITTDEVIAEYLTFFATSEE